MQSHLDDFWEEITSEQDKPEPHICEDTKPQDAACQESPYYRIARETAKLVMEKQEAYGDSFGNAQKVLEVLYPEGIRVDQLGDALTVTRIVDKLFRIANKKDAFGESPYLDILGYALLAVERDTNGT